MRHTITFLKRATVLGLALTALTLIAPAQQASRSASVRTQRFDIGKGMSTMNTDLMQVAGQSAMFLQFSEQIGLTAEQRKRLEEIYFDIQKFSVRRQADLDIADAELRRLLSNEQVDLDAVRLKLKEFESLRAEETMRSIEAALQAISTLRHEQHIKVMLLVRQNLKQELPAPRG